MNSILKGKSRIEEIDGNKYFIKQSKKNIGELFDYLKLRNFDNIPEVIGTDGKNIKYKFIEETDSNNQNKYKDLANILSALHYKTAYYKEVSKNRYREIYDKLSDKIDYMTDYYNKLIESIEMEIYPSPAHYLIERNFSIITGALSFAKSELKKWFKLVENKTKERVVVVHNNPKLEHLIKGDNNYLTNWDNYVVDTPILDLYKLYKDPIIFDNFKLFYEEYANNFKLSVEEKKLFFVLISLPPKIEELDDELLNTKNIKSIINYLYKSNELITFINSDKEVND